MGQLAERLERIREASKKSIAPQLREQMGRATEELRRSGQADGARGMGDRAPDFELPDSQGTIVRLGDSPAATVVSFFRGHW